MSSGAIQMDRARTSLHGGPRPLPGHRRADRNETLNSEEPQRQHKSGRADQDSPHKPSYREAAEDCRSQWATTKASLLSARFTSASSAASRSSHVLPRV